MVNKNERFSFTCPSNLNWLLLYFAWVTVGKIVIYIKTKQ